MKEIIVNIKKDGSVLVEVNGVAGTGCVELTRDLERALGNTTQRVAKPEMSQQESTDVGTDHRQH